MSAPRSNATPSLSWRQAAHRVSSDSGLSHFITGYPAAASLYSTSMQEQQLLLKGDERLSALRISPSPSHELVEQLRRTLVLWRRISVGLLCLCLLLTATSTRRLLPSSTIQWPYGSAPELVPAAPAQSQPLPSANAVRLARFLHRLESGLPVVVASIGGSNIAGGPHKVTQIFVEWLNERFSVNARQTASELFAENDAIDSACPHPVENGSSSETATRTGPVKHQLLNSGVGATPSALASFCYRRLVPCSSQESGKVPRYYHDPDLLLVEYSLNDVDSAGSDLGRLHPTVSMERLVRSVLSVSSRTAIIFVYVSRLFRQGLRNGEHLHRAVARHYHIPEVSFKQWARQQLYEPRFGVVREKQPQANFSRLLPSTVLLPLADIFHRHNISLDKELFMNEAHINDLGHSVLTSLLSAKLLFWHTNLLDSNFSSLSERWHSADDAVPLIHSPQASLPPPLFPSYAHSQHHYGCLNLYYPLNPQARIIGQRAAEEYLGIIYNSGWKYQQTAPGPGGDAQKYTLVIPAAEANTVGQTLSIRLPPAVQYLAISMVRTWNKTGAGEAEGWLSCELDVGRRPGSSSHVIRMPSLWTAGTTQIAFVEVWPLSEQALRLAASTNDVDELFLATAGSQHSCPQLYLHINHSVPGIVHFTGYVWQ